MMLLYQLVKLITQTNTIDEAQKMLEQIIEGGENDENRDDEDESRERGEDAWRKSTKDTWHANRN